MSKKTLFYLSILLLLVIVSFWFYRKGVFNKEILYLEILGPNEVSVGKEIEYLVRYKNNGNFILENPKLIFDLPQYSISEEGKTRIIQELKDIYPGQEQIIKIKARLLGKEGDIKIAKASLSYVPKNLTARYESTTTFSSKIVEVPLTLDFDFPSKVEKGKTFDYSINYFSAIDYPLENLTIKILKDDNLIIESSQPQSLEGSEWKIETLEKAKGGRINIKGKISADFNEKEFVFYAQLGMWQGENYIVLKEIKKEIEITQPFVYIFQLVNGDSSYLAVPGETLNYQIFFRNYGSLPLEDLFLAVKIEGSFVDISTLKINTEGGQLSANVIIWDSKKVSKLKYLGPHEEGMVEFSLKLKDNLEDSYQEDDLLITTQVNLSQNIQKFTVKVNYGLLISQSAFYSKEAGIENFGPIPPRVGESTSYTIKWEVKNYFEDIKNAKVKAVLPSNVRLTGVVLPSTELSKFSFDSSTNEVVWSVGDVLAKTGIKGDAYILFFQIVLTPLESQKNNFASLISEVEIKGENPKTGSIIKASDEGITTLLPDDFQNSGGGIVQ